MADNGTSKATKPGVAGRTPPLPVVRALARSLGQVMEHRGAAVRACAPWYLATLPVYLAAAYLGGAFDDAADEWNTWPIAFAGVSMLTFALPHAAVVWHRFALLGEAVPRRLGLTDRRSWIYVGNALRLMFASGIVTAFVAGIIAVIFSIPTEGLVSDLVLCGAIACGLVVAGGLAMTLPAGAMGRSSEIDNAVELAAGNVIRIGACLAIVAVAIYALLVLTHTLMQTRPGMTSAVLDLLIGQTILFAGAIVFANVLNNIYVWGDGRGPTGEVLSI